LIRPTIYAYGPTGNIQSVTRWPETTHLGYGAAANGAVAANTTRGSVTGLAGGAARLGFTQGDGITPPLGVSVRRN
jgi:hypothetical protein